ncbi:MAG: formate--tetrahydrofolate ligase, partial [Clostridia bacterium]
AEKFFDIKCRKAGLKPDCVVLVATVRALKYNGGIAKSELSCENVAALKDGMVNLMAHIENLSQFGVPVVVAINRFQSDTDEELSEIEEACKALGADFAISEVFARGGEGGLELAKKVIAIADSDVARFKPLYPNELAIKEKIAAIAGKIYGAASVSYTPSAERAIERIEKNGYRNLPVCIAKTQYSLSDDANALGRPEGFVIHINKVRLCSGAGFVVALAGDIMTMPGLPKSPAAERIDVSTDGVTSGLF